MRQLYRVFVDPSSKMLYSSFYLQGLYDEFGRRNVRFSSRYFSGLKRKAESHSFDHYMAFVIVGPAGQVNRIIIDFRDKPTVKPGAWDWCDRYAKINFNPVLTDQQYHKKIVSIGPSFGIRIWSLRETVGHCLANFVRCGFSPVAGRKEHLADYYGQFIRPTLGAYTRSQQASPKEQHAYVFMIARLWPNAFVDKTNLLRKRFMENCKAAHCDFEGGFFTSDGSSPDEEYRDVMVKRSYTTNEFLKNNQASAFVFNTPAVYNCHGWKLGEFLAMGKAIISTPLANILPGPLIHGVHIHYAEDEAELQTAINLLLTDRAYREKLEKGAVDYYRRYIEPRMVIRDLFAPVV